MPVLTQPGLELAHYVSMHRKSYVRVSRSARVLPPAAATICFGTDAGIRLDPTVCHLHPDECCRYATLLHNIAWGWIVTSFLTLISLLAVANLVRWSQHRMELLAAIADEQASYLQRVDIGLLSVGCLFGMLGMIVF